MNPWISGLLTCLLGAVGGAVFAFIGMPLPWLLGAMLATAVAALSGLRPHTPVAWRNGGLIVLGITVGSSYGPSSFGSVVDWIPSLALILLYSIIVGAACAFFLMRVARFNLPTAFFSGMPGGMNEMVIVGQQWGADARKVALSHAVRVLFVITAIALGFRLFGGYTPPPAPAAPTIIWWELLFLIGVAAVSVPVFVRLRFPAPFFMGPLLGALLLHVFDLSQAVPPAALVAIGQVLVGASLGSRFTGTTKAEITTTAFFSLQASFLQLAITGMVALMVGTMLGLDAAMLLLTFAPAGVAEMTLIALALGYDPAYVAVHQLVRLLFIFIAAPAFFRLMRARQGSKTQ